MWFPDARAFLEFSKQNPERDGISPELSLDSRAKDRQK
jgi:hypothetical protein